MTGTAATTKQEQLLQNRNDVINNPQCVVKDESEKQIPPLEAQYICIYSFPAVHDGYRRADIRDALRN